MIRRAVEVCLEPEFMGLMENFSPAQQAMLHSAVGYLSMWAIHSERYSGKLFLLGDKEGCLHATYHNSEGKCTYQIFGLRREDGSYSFHS